MIVAVGNTPKVELVNHADNRRVGHPVGAGQDFVLVRQAGEVQVHGVAHFHHGGYVGVGAVALPCRAQVQLVGEARRDLQHLPHAHEVANAAVGFGFNLQLAAALNLRFQLVHGILATEHGQRQPIG